jgi:L-rhamnose-H+ transport protein
MGFGISHDTGNHERDWNRFYELAGVDVLFGFGWGIGCVLFGLGLKLVGLALGTAIVLGLNNALGAILPLFLSHQSEIATASGRTLLAGVIMMLFGVALCSWAGAQKERESAKGESDRPRPQV